MKSNPLRVTFPIAASLLLASFVLGCGNERSGSGPEVRNLILISVDTWRADHFLTARSGTPLTPELAAFAERSLVFSDATSVGNATSPGVAGIFTGLLPHRSGVVVNSHVLPDTLPTLATVLDREGFRTAAFVANPVLDVGYGFERGFDHYESVRPGPGANKARADALSHRAVDWLEAHAGPDRVFLWLHYMEPHGPYRPPPEQRALFALDGFGAPRNRNLLPPGDNSGQGGIPHYQWGYLAPAPVDARDYLGRYAGEVRFADQEIGRLLQHVERKGFLDESVVVLTSDHGEALDDDNGFFFSHGNELTQDQVHVPLLIYYPGCEGGRGVGRPVSTVDILPTVLGLLGVSEPVDIDGVDLLRERASTVMSLTRQEVALREGPWKLRMQKGGGYRLVNLRRAPRASEGAPLESTKRIRALRARLHKLQERSSLGRSRFRSEVEGDERARLEALGYL